MIDHSERNRLLLLVLILALVGLATGGATLAILYETALAQNNQRLLESVQSRARLIEAVVRHDMRQFPDPQEKSARDQLLGETLDQLREAQQSFPGLGVTGEFVLGRREGDQIVFLLHRRHDQTDKPIPIPYDSPNAEPMRRAINGKEGMVIGLDYRGELVLAAHAPVHLLDVGIVAKIDMAEIREPFLQAAQVAFAVGSLLIFIGAFFFIRISEPILIQAQETRLLRENRKKLEEAQAALNEKALYLDNILRTATEMAIIATDAAFKIKYCNPAAERFHKLAAGQIIGQTVQKIHHERGVDNQRFMKGIAEVHLHGEYRYEVRGLHDGRELILESRVSSIKDNLGQLVGYLLMARDVTSDRQAREELIRSERRYRLLVESANDAILVADAESGYIIDANRMAETLLLRPVSEIIGLHQTVIHPPEEKELYAGLFREHVMGQRDSLADIEVVRSDGERVPVEVRAAVTDLGDQKVILGIFRNITERIRNEEALRNSMDSLAQAQMIAHLGNWVWDMTSNRLEWSDEVYRIFGYPPKSCDPTYEFFLQAVHPLDRALVTDAIQKATVAPYTPYNIEHRIIRPDGQEFYVHERGEILLDTKGTPLRMVGTVQDVTTRKNLELRLQTLNQVLELRVAQRTQELERSNRDLQQFAYVASHDLQEPLRLVSGFVQLLEKRYSGALDEKATKYIAYVVDGVKHMDSLINSLLTYARVGSQAEPLVPTPAQESLDRALRYLGQVMMETKTVITCDPLPTVMADEGQLTQVFQNLIGNAIKFRSDEPPRIHVSCQRQGGQWLFSFQDNGIGIEEKFSDRIFVIFQKLHSRARYEGTGIGLALCKRIIERHEGRIWVESTLGKGSTFFITLPALEQ